MAPQPCDILYGVVIWRFYFTKPYVEFMWYCSLSCYFQSVREQNRGNRRREAIDYSVLTGRFMGLEHAMGSQDETGEKPPSDKLDGGIDLGAFITPQG